MYALRLRAYGPAPAVLMEDSIRYFLMVLFNDAVGTETI
jgi:hypothetical protein